MAIIYNYPLNSILLAEDMLIGTSTKIVNGQPKNATKNFSIGDLTGFIKQNVSLDDVLLVGNTSLLDAKIGSLYLYDTPVADYGNITLNQNRFSFNTVTQGEVFRVQRDMFSSFSSSGYRGSFEVSNITANRVWDFPDKSGTVALLSDVPVTATPTLQEVTDAGNETTNNAIFRLNADRYIIIDRDNQTVLIENTITGSYSGFSLDTMGVYSGSGESLFLTPTEFVLNGSGYGFPKGQGLDLAISPLIVTSGTHYSYVDSIYSANGTITFIDPTPITNKGYIVHVISGTSTIGGIGYTSGALVYRFYNGTAWVSTDMNAGSATSTLQQVTNEGNTTTNSITVSGITSGNFSSDGYGVYISDSSDGINNFQYVPYAGLFVGNGTDIYTQIFSSEASIGFQTLAGFGNLRSDLVTGVRTWQLPDASGTLALTSNIPAVGTWGALNYPTWTTGTPFVKMTAAGTFALDTTSYYPYPTGTISQYIRGDGTLATFPSVATPTLQQVTSAGNTTTDSIFLQSGLSPLSTILSNSYISVSNNITNRQISISTSNDIAFSDVGGSSLYLKGPATITATNTQTLQNASGTIALLSDIPTTSGIPHAIASGTDTYTATVSGVTAYNDADAYLIRFTNGNTTGATLNINSLGAVPLYRNNDGPLLGGDVANGGEMLCIYNSTLNEFQVIGISPNSLIAYITNDDSVTITKGQAVYAFSGTGDRMTVKLANNVGDFTSAQTMGLVLSASIGPNQKGFIITQGLLDGLNTLPTATYSDGDPIYLGSTAGSITNIKPYAPNHLVYLGIVTTASNGSSGRMYVKVQNGYELDELHNVQAQTPSLNDTLWYDNTVSPAQWKTASIPTILGYTPTNLGLVQAMTQGLQNIF